MVKLCMASGLPWSMSRLVKGVGLVQRVVGDGEVKGCGVICRSTPQKRPPSTKPGRKPHRSASLGRGGAPLAFKVPRGAGDGFRSYSLLSRLLPALTLVWTRSKLLVLERRLVNSVKLSRLALDVERRFSLPDRGFPSSDVLPGGAFGTSKRSCGEGTSGGWL